MTVIEQLLSAARDVIESADNAGCESPLTVTDENAVERLRLMVAEVRKDQESGKLAINLDHLPWEILLSHRGQPIRMRSKITVNDQPMEVQACAVNWTESDYDPTPVKYNTDPRCEWVDAEEGKFFEREECLMRIAGYDRDYMIRIVHPQYE